MSYWVGFNKNAAFDIACICTVLDDDILYPTRHLATDNYAVKALEAAQAYEDIA